MQTISLICRKWCLILPLLLILTVSFAIDIETRRISPDTVLAEYDGGTLIKADYDEEFRRLPLMFRARFSTSEGRREFLESIVINRICYLKAEELGIDRDPETFIKHRDDLKPFYASIYRREEIGKEVREVEESTRIRERELKQRKVNELKRKYEVQIDQNRLASLDMLALTIDSDIFTEKIVTATLSELNISVGDLFVHYQTLSPYILNDDMTTDFSYYNHYRFLSREEWAELNSPETIERLVNNIIEVNLFDYEAREMGYDEYLYDDPEREIIARDPEGSRFDLAVFENPEVRQLRKHIILKTLFDRLVVDVADPTKEEIKEYYRNNIDDYSVDESRRLQIFVYDTEEEALRSREVVTQAVRESDEWTIIDMIRSSRYPQIVRAMQFVERNRALPYFGEDSKLYELIWNSAPGELSEVTRSDTGLYYFLTVIEHNPSHTYPLEQFEREITNTLTYQARTRRWQEVVRDLFEEYQVKLYPDKLFIILEADEYFALAEQAQNRGRYLEAIRHYNSIIEHHKNNEDDYRALFAKAFTYAGELGEKEKGIELFQQLINEYPTGELHESAEFMIETFSRGQIPVDNLD